MVKAYTWQALNTKRAVLQEHPRLFLRCFQVNAINTPLPIGLSCRSALDGDCGFLAANLYAKSVFGEDALVNVSIEKQTDGKLSGYIRIRSKTQGIALSLGDKITLKQKGGS